MESQLGFRRPKGSEKRISGDDDDNNDDDDEDEEEEDVLNRKAKSKILFSAKKVLKIITIGHNLKYEETNMM